MTPIATSYTVSKELTGYTEDQTIKPNELNLWRVLQINQDETIDIISVYTSSDKIWFSEELGFRNYIGVLNDLASAYTNSNYTVGSRYPGYNGQTEFITEPLSKETSGDFTTGAAGWDASVEPYGGGDNFYQKDYALIQKALNTRIAYRVDEQDTIVNYWFASRWLVVDYNYGTSSHYDDLWYGRIINGNGNITSNGGFHGLNGEIHTGNTFQTGSYIRPIVTLKSNLTPISGDGSEGSPWTFKTE